jgi:hypothetical protein
MGSPGKSNVMSKYPDNEKIKEILVVAPRDYLTELENLTIEESWEKYGRVGDGGLVTNLKTDWHTYSHSEEILDILRKPKSAAHNKANSESQRGIPQVWARKDIYKDGVLFAKGVGEAAKKLGLSGTMMSNILHGKNLSKNNAHLAGVYTIGNNGAK